MFTWWLTYKCGDFATMRSRLKGDTFEQAIKKWSSHNIAAKRRDLKILNVRKA